MSSTTATALPKVWSCSTIGEQVCLVNGFGFKPHDWKESGTPIVRIQNLNDRTAPFDYVQGTVSARFRVSSGDLLFAWSGSRGTSFGPFLWDRGDAVLNQHIFNLGFRNTDLDKRFCYYWLKSLVPEIEQAAHGSAGLVHVTRTELERFRFPVVPPPEQRKIARILTTLDSLIEKTEALIAKYMAIKQGMMHDLFIRGVDKHGHLRPTYAEAPDLYKPSELGWIPKEWDTPIFDDVTPIDAPICYGIVQPGEYDERGVPVVAIYNLHTDFKRCHRSSLQIESKYARSRLRAGDVLLSVKGTTGRVDVVPAEFEGNISRDIARVRPRSGVSAKYLCYMLDSPLFRRLLTNAIVGTTRAELSIAVLRRLRLVLPRSGEQEGIADSLQSTDAWLQSERAQHEKLLRIKTGLMQDLLTGKVRVNVDESEEATAHV